MTRDVYRNEKGEPVTLSEEQLRAVWHAINVWLDVCHTEGSFQGFNYADIAKSRLLGRMLIDGRPPLDEPPPHWAGACAYHLVEPDLPHYYYGDAGGVS